MHIKGVTIDACIRYNTFWRVKITRNGENSLLENPKPKRLWRWKSNEQKKEGHSESSIGERKTSKPAYDEAIDSEKAPQLRTSVSTRPARCCSSFVTESTTWRRCHYLNRFHGLLSRFGNRPSFPWMPRSQWKSVASRKSRLPVLSVVGRVERGTKPSKNPPFCR